MWWLTDGCPHESLPLKETSFRQYFRLVTSDVSVWYSDHSTHNPVMSARDLWPPPGVQILEGSKFEEVDELPIIS